MHFVTVLAGLVAAMFLATAAEASSLFLDGSGTATLGIGDTIDQVVLTDTSHVDIDIGAVIGEVTLLDESTADIFGGSITSLEVFEDGSATLHGVDDSFTVDGNPAPAVITAADCPTCTLAGTLDVGISLAAEVSQNGTINVPVSVVPEPSTAAMMSLGLFGLAAFPRRRD